MISFIFWFKINSWGKCYLIVGEKFISCYNSVVFMLWRGGGGVYNSEVFKSNCIPLNLEKNAT